MTSYRPVIHTAAKRELDSLNDTARERLTDLLADVAREREPSSHEKVKPLEGKDGLLRVRVGDYRAIIELEQPDLCVLRCGHRSSVYDVVDEIGDRRASA